VKAVAAEEFQHWKLTVNADRTAMLACDDGNDHVIYTKRIEYTDIPLGYVRFYVANKTILLPSEY
jgi:Family of unknown function (DUF6876)